MSFVRSTYLNPFNNLTWTAITPNQQKWKKERKRLIMANKYKLNSSPKIVIVLKYLDSWHFQRPSRDSISQWIVVLDSSFTPLIHHQLNVEIK